MAGEQETLNFIKTGIDRLFTSFDMVREDISKLHSKVDKIESHNNILSEKLLKVELIQENFDKNHSKCELKLEQKFDIVFSEIRDKELEVKNFCIDKIESENTKQNLKIIATAVGFSVSLTVVINFLLGLFK